MKAHSESRVLECTDPEHGPHGRGWTTSHGEWVLFRLRPPRRKDRPEEKGTGNSHLLSEAECCVGHSCVSAAAAELCPGVDKALRRQIKIEKQAESEEGRGLSSQLSDPKETPIPPTPKGSPYIQNVLKLDYRISGGQIKPSIPQELQKLFPICQKGVTVLTSGRRDRWLSTDIFGLVGCILKQLPGSGLSQYHKYLIRISSLC